MTRRAPIVRSCVHFTGLRNAKCNAEVLYVLVADRSVSPIALPCLVIPGLTVAKTSCEKFREATAEELAAEDAAFNSSWASRAEALSKGECPFCGSAIRDQRQVGRRVYAEPCGHCLYQGPRGKK